MDENGSIHLCYKLIKTIREQSELVKCPICLEIYTNPIQLKCKHSFCAECLENSIKINVVCPICRQLINRREKYFNEKINGLAKYVKAMIGKLDSTVNINKYNFRPSLQNEERLKTSSRIIKTCNENILPITSISKTPKTKMKVKNKITDVTNIKSAVKNKENFLPPLNRKKRTSTDAGPSSIQKKNNAPATSRKDAFDILLESSRNKNYPMKKPLRTYRNKNKQQKEEICDNLINFEDETNKTNVLKWLADNRNKFDYISLTQQDYNDDNASTHSFDIDSISQVGKNKAAKDYQKQMKEIRKSRADLFEKSCYERRCRSLDIHLARYFYQKPLKRKSIACESQEFEKVEIEEIDSEKLIVTKEQKRIYNLLEEECVNKFEAMFTEPVEKENTNKNKTRIEKINTSATSSGWTRMKDMKKIIKKQERNPRKLKVSQQSTIKTKKQKHKECDNDSTSSFSSPEKAVKISDKSRISKKIAKPVECMETKANLSVKTKKRKPKECDNDSTSSFSSPEKAVKISDKSNILKKIAKPLKCMEINENLSIKTKKRKAKEWKDDSTSSFSSPEKAVKISDKSKELKKFLNPDLHCVKTTKENEPLKTKKQKPKECDNSTSSFSSPEKAVKVSDKSKVLKKFLNPDFQCTKTTKENEPLKTKKQKPKECDNSTSSFSSPEKAVKISDKSKVLKKFGKPAIDLESLETFYKNHITEVTIPSNHDSDKSLENTKTPPQNASPSKITNSEKELMDKVEHGTLCSTIQDILLNKATEGRLSSDEQDLLLLTLNSNTSKARLSETEKDLVLDRVSKGNLSTEEKVSIRDKISFKASSSKDKTGDDNEDQLLPTSRIGFNHNKVAKEMFGDKDISKDKEESSNDERLSNSVRSKIIPKKILAKELSQKLENNEDKNLPITKVSKKKGAISTKKELLLIKGSSRESILSSDEYLPITKAVLSSDEESQLLTTASHSKQRLSGSEIDLLHTSFVELKSKEEFLENSESPIKKLLRQSFEELQGVVDEEYNAAEKNKRSDSLLKNDDLKKEEPILIIKDLSAIKQIQNKNDMLFPKSNENLLSSKQLVVVIEKSNILAENTAKFTSFEAGNKGNAPKLDETSKKLPSSNTLENSAVIEKSNILAENTAKFTAFEADKAGNKGNTPKSKKLPSSNTLENLAVIEKRNTFAENTAKFTPFEADEAGNKGSTPKTKKISSSNTLENLPVIEKSNIFAENTAKLCSFETDEAGNKGNTPKLDETFKKLPSSNTLENLAVKDSQKLNNRKNKLVGKGVQIKLNTNDRAILRDYVDASNENTIYESVRNKDDKKKITVLKNVIIRNDEKSNKTAENCKDLIENKSSSLGINHLQNSPETGYKSSFEPQSPKFLVEYMKQKLQEKIASDEKSALGKSSHKRRRLSTQEMKVLLNEGDLILNKYTNIFSSPKNDFNPPVAKTDNARKNLFGQDLPRKEGSNMERNLCKKAETVLPKRTNLKNKKIETITRQEQIIPDPSLFEGLICNEVTIMNPEMNETIFNIDTQLVSDVEEAQDEVSKLSTLLQASIKQFEKIKSTTDPQLLRILNDKYDLSDNFDGILTRELQTYVKKFDTILSSNLDSDVNKVSIDVNTQTFADKLDKSLQTDLYTSGFLISATEDFKTQTNQVTSVQTDPIVCRNCNHPFMQNKPTNAREFELSASFDGIDFETQAALTESNRLNQRVSKIESQFIRSGTFDGLVFETQAAIEEHGKNVLNAKHLLVKSGTTKIQKGIKDRQTLATCGSSAPSELIKLESRRKIESQLLKAGTSRSLSCSDSPIIKAAKLLESGTINASKHIISDTAEVEKNQSKTDSQLLQSASFDGLVFETQAAIKENENLKKSLSKADSTFLQSNSFDGLDFETQAAIANNARIKRHVSERMQPKSSDDKTITQILIDLNNANSENIATSPLIGSYHKITKKHSQTAGTSKSCNDMQSPVEISGTLEILQGDLKIGKKDLEKPGTSKTHRLEKVDQNSELLELSQVLKCSSSNKKKRSQKYDKINRTKNSENHIEYLNSQAPLSPDIVNSDSYRKSNKHTQLRNKQDSNVTSMTIDNLNHTSKKRSPDYDDDLLNSKIIKLPRKSKTNELENYVGNMKKLLTKPEAKQSTPENYLLDLERQAPTQNSNLLFSLSDPMGKFFKPNSDRFKRARILSDSDSEDGNPKKNKYVREDISVCFDTETQAGKTIEADVINMDKLNNMYEDAIGVPQKDKDHETSKLPFIKTKSQELVENCNLAIKKITNKCEALERVIETVDLTIEDAGILEEFKNTYNPESNEKQSPNTSFTNVKSKSSKIPVRVGLSESLFNFESFATRKMKSFDQKTRDLDFSAPKTNTSESTFNSENIIPGTVFEQTVKNQNSRDLIEFNKEDDVDLQMGMIKSKYLETLPSIHALVEEHDGIEFLDKDKTLVNNNDVINCEKRPNVKTSILEDDEEFEAWKTGDFNKETAVKILGDVVVVNPKLNDDEDDINIISGSDVDVIETTPQKPKTRIPRNSQFELSVIIEHNDVEKVASRENTISPDVFHSADCEQTFVPKILEKKKIIANLNTHINDKDENKQIDRPNKMFTSTEKDIDLDTSNIQTEENHLKRSGEASLWGSQSVKISPIKKISEKPVLSQSSVKFLKKTSTPMQTSIRKFMTKTKSSTNKSSPTKGEELFKFSIVDKTVTPDLSVEQNMNSKKLIDDIEHKRAEDLGTYVSSVGRQNMTGNDDYNDNPEILESTKKTQNIMRLRRSSHTNPQKQDFTVKHSTLPSFTGGGTLDMSLHAKRICLTISRLPKEKSNRVIQFVNKHQSTVDLSHDFNANVTHLIVDVHADNCLHSYTAKFVQAVANRLWVVRFDWIAECIKEDRIVSEEPYEVLDGRSEPGPRLSRIFGHERPLLKGFKIYISPPISTLSVSELHAIITKLGGQIALDPNEFLHKRNSEICVIIAENEKTQDINKYEMWLQDLKVITVELEWLTFSVGQYRWKTLRRYALCSEDFDDLDYPPQLLEYVPLTPPSSYEGSEENTVGNVEIE